MPNLATNKNEISTGLAVKPGHITDCIDALTGAKTFDDVEAKRTKGDNTEYRNSNGLTGEYNAVVMNPFAAKKNVSNKSNTRIYNDANVIEEGKTVGINITDSNKYIAIANNTNIQFGLNSFSIAWIETFPLAFSSSYSQIFFKGYGGAGGFTFTTDATGSNYNILYAENNGSTGINVTTFQVPSFLTGAKLCVFTKDTVNKKISLSVGGILVKSASYSVVVDLNSTGQLKFRGGAFTVKDSLFMLFNYALSADEVRKLGNNGKPTLRPLDSYMKWGSNTNLTSGTLVIGKRYRIKTFNTGDDFTNVATVLSGTINTTGSEFLCKATTPTIWTNASVLIQTGAVASYTPQGIVIPDTVTGSDLTAVEAGKPYEIVNIGNSGGTTNWTQCGAVNPAVGTRFVSGYAGNITFGGKVRLVGATAWLNESGNAGLDATIAGNPIVTKEQMEDVNNDGFKNMLLPSAQFTASGAGPHDLGIDVPVGYMISEVGVERTAGTGSRSLAIKAGSSSGTTVGTCTHADDYSSTIELQNLNNFIFTKKRMSKTANVRLYMTGSQAGDSWIVNVKMEVTQ